MSRARRALLVVLVLTHAACDVRAQDQDDSTAYRALTQTPLQAFSPLPGAALASDRNLGASVQVRYGLMSFRSRDFIHNFGLGASVPVAAGQLSITAGVYNPTCPRDDCPDHFMASLEFEQNLVGVAFGRPEQSGHFNLGLTTGVGLGIPEGTALFSASASLRLSVVPRFSGTRIYPFLSPGVGFGLAEGSGPGVDGGMLPILGGGVGLLTRDDRVGVTAGISRVFLSGGNWLAGVNVSVNLKRAKGDASEGLAPDL